uniref:Uncharacterized protein n=1 Tax=Anguilla anguilla TaxID=7936 RepID=A0A0E9QSV5_ANGAN
MTHEEDCVQHTCEFRLVEALFIFQGPFCVCVRVCFVHVSTHLGKHT